MSDVKPNCRYGHGDLVLFSRNDTSEKWGYVSKSERPFMFSGNLYVCTVCGYTEIFDDDVEQTKKDLEDQP